MPGSMFRRERARRSRRQKAWARFNRSSLNFVREGHRTCAPLIGPSKLRRMLNVRKASKLPVRAGVGFKPVHFRTILVEPQPIGFFEVHAENYMGAGGPPHAQLAALRQRYPLSLHGVGLSIGSMQPLDRDPLARLRSLCDRYEPESFSEHLARSSHDGVYFNDLLPLPYTRQTLARVAEHIDTVQTTLHRQMLLENPSTYVGIAESAPEVEFLA